LRRFRDILSHSLIYYTTKLENIFQNHPAALMEKMRLKKVSIKTAKNKPRYNVFKELREEWKKKN